MKKLMVMLSAAAMAFGLFAADDPAPSNYYSNSFEADDGGSSSGTEFDWAAAGWSYADGAANPALAAQSGTLPYGESTAPDRRRNEFFAGGAKNEKYLQLETGKNTLSHGIGDGQVFVDQLVKFTGFEEEQTFDPEDENCPKIAVWMSGYEDDAEAVPAVVGETNLYVAVGTDSGITNVKLDYDVEPDTWYRLTIKSLGNVNTAAGRGTQLGFQIFINGAPVAIVEDERAYNDAWEQFEAGAKALYGKGQLFTSMTTDGTVAAIAYNGIGGLDDLIISEDAPDFAAATPVQLAIPDYTTVVVVKDSEGNEIPLEGGVYSIPAGMKMDVTLAADAGYFFKGGRLQFTKTDIEPAAEVTITLGDDDALEAAAAKKVVNEEITYFYTLQNAIDDTTVEAEIQLCGAVELAAPITAPAGAEFTLDLCQFEITSAEDFTGGDYLFELGNATAIVKNGTITTDKRAFHVVGGDLTVDLLTANCDGRVIGAYAGSAVEVDSEASLTTSGDDVTIFVRGNTVNKSTEGTKGTLVVYGTVANEFDGDQNAISGNGWDWVGVDITIAGTVFTTGTGAAIYKPQAGTLTITGDETSVTGATGIYAKSGAVVIDGGYVYASGETADPEVNNNGITSTGDALVLEKLEAGAGGYSNDLTCEITGGTFESENGYAVRSWAREGITALAGFIGEGALFKGAEMPTDYIVEVSGYEAKWSEPDEDGYVTAEWEEVKDPVAQIGDKKFETLQEAVTAAKATDRVELLADITLTDHVQVEKNLTVDLKGKTIKTTAGCRNAATAFNVDGAYTVNISNGSIDASEVDETQTVDKEVDVLLVRNGGTLNLEDVNVTMDSKNGACAYAFAGSYININGGAYNNMTLQDYEFKPGVKGMPLNQANVADQLITVSAGSFRQYNPALGDDAGLCKTFLATGKASVMDADGWYKVDTAIIATFKVQDDVYTAETNIVAFTPATPVAPVVEGYEFTGWLPEIKEISASTEFVAQLEPIATDITVTVKKGDGIAGVTVGGGALEFDANNEATFTVKPDALTATLTLVAESSIKIPAYTMSIGKNSEGWTVTNKTPVITADAENAAKNYFNFAAEEASTTDPAITDAAAATAIKEAAPAVADKVDELTTGDGAIGGKALVNWIATKGSNNPSVALAGNFVKASVALDVAPITESTQVEVATVDKTTSDLAVTIKVAGQDATKEQIEGFVQVCDDLGAANDWEKLPESTLKSAVTISEGKLVITPVAGVDKLFLKVVIPQDAK